MHYSEESGPVKRKQVCVYIYIYVSILRFYKCGGHMPCLHLNVPIYISGSPKDRIWKE